MVDGMTHPIADAARKFIRTAGVPSYEGYELQIRELADALDATMTTIDFTKLRPKKRPPTRKEAARYRRWVSYLKNSRLSLDEVYRRAEAFTSAGREPPL